METNPTRDRLIADARSLPDLVQQASVYDPALAQALTGKALLASKTVWGNVLSPVVAFVVTRYGLGWDPATCDLVTGGVLAAATLLFRAITNSPITGLFRAAPPIETARSPVSSMLGAVAVGAGLCLSLLACSADQQKQADTTLRVAQAAIVSAVNQWQIAKGIAEVAAASDPRLAPSIASVIAQVDPKIAKAMAAAEMASADARALIVLAAQISARAAEITATAAPAVRVVAVPN